MAPNSLTLTARLAQYPHEQRRQPPPRPRLRPRRRRAVARFPGRLVEVCRAPRRRRGVIAVEITMTVPDALDVVRAVRRALGDRDPARRGDDPRPGDGAGGAAGGGGIPRRADGEPRRDPPVPEVRQAGHARRVHADGGPGGVGGGGRHRQGVPRRGAGAGLLQGGARAAAAGTHDADGRRGPHDGGRLPEGRGVLPRRRQPARRAARRSRRANFDRIRDLARQYVAGGRQDAPSP